MTEAGLAMLPEWDLRDLYPAIDAPELAQELDRAETEAKAFHGAHAGKIAALDGAALGAAIEAYESLQDRLGRVLS